MNIIDLHEKASRRTTETLPLRETEKKMIFWNSAPIIFFISIVSFFGLVFTVYKVVLSPDVQNGVNYIQSVGFLLLFFVCIVRFFDRPTTKEIFTSRLSDYTKIGHLTLYFEDYFVGLSPLFGSGIRRKMLCVGKEYRIHKVQGRSLIIALDLLDASEV